MIWSLVLKQEALLWLFLIFFFIPCSTNDNKMATTKRTWEPIIDQMYASVFSDLNKKRFEKITLYLSIIGFLLHLILIYAKKLELVVFSFETPLLDNPISAIYTPFTIILIYEIYLLVLNLPRSFTTSVSKQFEIISLILIRRIFADIPKVDISANWFSTEENLGLIYDVLGVLILYYLNSAMSDFS